ncbi:hypothetical protein L6452_17327 [Arctium lappa]|uniref:Uncharacterized protein n=1 Tax=Arctium lappa TaxID=4217 RepID=A0ACB9C2Y7_ARCLA|nr:hypothetical protein L6452_17327 [Arctium lappa]
MDCRLREIGRGDSYRSIKEVSAGESLPKIMLLFGRVKETDVELDLQEVESLFAGILSDQESPSSSSSRTELSSYPDYAVLCDLSPQTFEDELVGNFWTAPFLRDNDSIGPSCDNLLSTFNFVNDFISHPPSCQDMMMSDEFLWSTLDTFVDDNMDYIN